MKNSIIYYPPGCYGTFLEWCYNYFDITSTIKDYPFDQSGGSHSFEGNFLIKPVLLEYVKSNNELTIARCHPSLFENINSNDLIKNNFFVEIVSKDLDFLSSNFDKVVVCYADHRNSLWLENNIIHKCFVTPEIIESIYEPWGYTKDFFKSVTLDQNKRFCETLQDELDITNINQWNKNIYDFDRWELRELLSYYWFDRYKDAYSCWATINKKYPNIYYISLNDLKNHFCKTITNLLNFLNVTICNDKISELEKLENAWKKVQFHMNKDEQVQSIISSIINDEYVAWDNLSLIDEAYIQKKLREQNITIKCWNLNQFPKNSTELIDLLEFN